MAITNQIAILLLQWMVCYSETFPRASQDDPPCLVTCLEIFGGR